MLLFTKDVTSTCASDAGNLVQPYVRDLATVVILGGQGGHSSGPKLMIARSGSYICFRPRDLAVTKAAAVLPSPLAHKIIACFFVCVYVERKS